MASDGSPGQIPVASLVQGSQAATNITQPAGGKLLPVAGNIPAAPSRADVGSAATNAGLAARKTQQLRNADAQSQVAALNKYLNDSGRPDQFRLDPSLGNKVIQQINPANGAILGEFSVDEFPALARSIGASGLLVDDLA